jgi:UDP-N-acetylmuramoyl-tripeptide--D-alanyl-D-alanine ligase
MEAVSLQWAAEVLKARTIGTPTGNVSGICTDTRQGAQDALFFALQGENSDGHQYVAQAFEKGAVGAVVAREVKGVKGLQLVVPDTLKALGELAKQYRRQFAIPVVAVTGSIGKTSTKEMIAQVLRAKYRTLANEKNFNNEIGVPLTLFRLTREHQAAVVEMGMRGVGQIDELAAIAEPTLAVITNVGYAHVELLGSREKIAEAKAELLARLPADGYAILPYRDDFYATLRSRVPEGVKVLTYGTGDEKDWPPDVRIYPLRQDSATECEANVILHRKETHFTLKAIGTHHLHNAGAAFAVAYALDIPLYDAADALEEWEGAEGRMTLTHTADGLTVLDDCYNAGPESMEAALTTLAQTTVLGGVAVLGDMRELGDYAPELHRLVGRKVIETGVRKLIVVGELALEIAEEAQRYATEVGKPVPEIHRFADTEEAVSKIRSLVQPKDAVLVKGSRAMHMESIVTALTGQESPNRHA